MLETLRDAGPRVGVALVVLVVLVAVGKLAGLGVRRRYLTRDRPSFAHVMGRVVSLVATTVGLLVAATIVFPTVRPVDVLSSLGIFSIAVGFAFRDILENLLAGVLLLFRAPFRTGDEVDVEGTQGTVVEINLRETVLRRYDGQHVLVPNSSVYKNPIVVRTGAGPVRSEIPVGIAYEADVTSAAALAVRAMEGCRGVLSDPAPAALVDALGTSTVDLRLLFWSEPEQRHVRTARDQVLQAVLSAFTEADIEMPADIVLLQGTPSLQAALHERDLEPTPGGQVRPRPDRTD